MRSSLVWSDRLGLCTHRKRKIEREGNDRQEIQ
jgi:hypothetical protein